MARAALKLGVRDLAALAGVSAMTVTRFENGHTKGYDETLERLKRALEAAGVIFIVVDRGEGVVKLRGASGATIPAADLNASNDE